jgi:hypothetical protein
LDALDQKGASSVTGLEGSLFVVAINPVFSFLEHAGFFCLTTVEKTMI